MSANIETMRFISRQIVPVAFSLLPPGMTSDRAQAMLLAVGMQESKFDVRIQQPIGPARSFWQFEKSGILGVLTHPASAPYVTPVLTKLRYPDTVDAIYTAIMHNDVLACVMARLLIWTVAAPLPGKGEPTRSWKQYLDAWNPGKPHPETWEDYFEEAWHETSVCNL